MIAFAQCDDFIMLIEEEISTNEKEMLKQECRVFNLKTQELSPPSVIGSWTIRIGPWKRIESEIYTKEQIREWLSK